MNKSNKLATGFAITGALVTIASRLIPHIPNFTAVQALALFAGAYLGMRLIAFAIPLLTWYGSDLIINNTVARSFFTETEGVVLYSNYMLGTLISAVLIGILGARFLKKWNAPKLALSAVGATGIFYLVTNFGAWLGNPIYAQDFSGLMASYTAGIPFVGNSLLSNLVYTAILFGGFEIVHNYLYKESAQLNRA